MELMYALCVLMLFAFFWTLNSINRGVWACVKQMKEQRNFLYEVENRKIEAKWRSNEDRR